MIVPKFFGKYSYLDMTKVIKKFFMGKYVIDNKEWHKKRLFKIIKVSVGNWLDVWLTLEVIKGDRKGRIFKRRFKTTDGFSINMFDDYIVALVNL